MLARAIIARRFRVAPLVLLLACGVLQGFVPAMRRVHLPPEAVLLLFLPALLYWESLTTSLREIRSNLRVIVLLSTRGGQLTSHAARRPQSMRTTTLGSKGPEVGVIGLGCMGMTFSYDMETPRDEATSISVIHGALDLGMTLIDTADAYGPHTNEELVGRALAGRRERAVLATKVGLLADSVEAVNPGGSSPGAGRDGRPEHVRRSIDGSLRRLRTDHVDLYQLHRVDPQVPLEETWGGDGRDRGGGQGTTHRPVRGDGRGDQAGAGGTSGDVGAVRAVAVDPGRAGRGTAVLPGPRHRLPAVLAARTGFPHRTVRLARRPAAG